MSRSYRKHKCIKIAGSSDKKDKVCANRRLRKKNKLYLRNGIYYPLALLREVSDVWSFNSDGLAYYFDSDDKRLLNK